MFSKIRKTTMLCLIATGLTFGVTATPAVAQPTPIVQSVVYGGGGGEGGPLLGSGCDRPLAQTFCKDLAGRIFICSCEMGVGGRWIWIKAPCA